MYHLPEHYPVANNLRAKLLALQEGRDEDKFAWTYQIPSAYYPDTYKVSTK